jgi:glycosyltransferase involved in cell wall biosynthesis
MAEELPTYAVRPRIRRALGRVGGWLDSAVPRRADFCIAVTEELGAHLRRGGVREPALACIAPVGAPGELDGPWTEAGADVPPLVCYAGNLDGYQNLDVLLASFAAVRAAVPLARLVLVTHADARAQAKRLAARGLGAGVEIVAASSYDDVRARLAEAAVAVSPRRERSGFPMKLLNYMAAGKAIVAAAGSAKGLLDGVTGRVVPDDDVEAFAGAIVELLRNVQLRERLGAAARRAVEDDAAWERVLDRIEAIYRHVVASAHPRLAAITITE